MPIVSTPTFAIQGVIKDSTKSQITVTYTVTFDSNDQALNTPYKSHAYVIGDDTLVPGDAAGGQDDSRWNWALRVIHPNPAVQTFTDTFEIPDTALNEDNAIEEPANSNPDEIRVRIGLAPLQAYTVMSPESSMQKITFV
jgi:hypothetical protein